MGHDFEPFFKLIRSMKLVTLDSLTWKLWNSSDVRIQKGQDGKKKQVKDESQKQLEKNLILDFLIFWLLANSLFTLFSLCLSPFLIQILVVLCSFHVYESNEISFMSQISQNRD